jgi:cAMP-dependent protein kinase regulator
MKREKYEEFLKGVPILASMDSYERNKLADAIKEQWFQAGDYVITQGTSGDVFYLIMQGKATATKTLTPGSPAQPVA